MLVVDSKAYIINLGDNRGYLYRDDQMYKLSIDHIPVFHGLYLESGRLKSKDRGNRYFHSIRKIKW